MQLVHDFIVNEESVFPTTDCFTRFTQRRNCRKTAHKHENLPKMADFVMFHTFHGYFSILSIARPYCLLQSHFACF